jgi:hypothetical protein
MTIVYNNLSTPAGTFSPQTLDTTFDNGQQFETASTASVINDLELVLGATVSSGTLTVDLYSDASNAPGSLVATLGTISNSQLTSTQGTIDLALTSNPVLTASTNYWIMLSDTSSTGASWSFAASAAGTGTSGGYYDSQGGITSNNDATYPQPWSMEITTACYAAGTRILTARGEIAVEDLRVGDLAVALLGRRLAPIRWIGQRMVEIARHPRPWDVAPIRVLAGAFGPDAPRRDLVLSPDHAVLVDDMLVPIRYLINGATVRQETPARVRYFHVELDRHDVLLAEGLPAESFLDTGNRASFENGGARVAMTPEFARSVWADEACAPLETEGPAIDAMRARLFERARALGFATGDDADLRVFAGGRELAAAVSGANWQVELPPGTRSVRLCSHDFVPAEMRIAADSRRLGVAIAALMLDDTPAAASAFLGGWHAAEPGLRWTDGEAELITGDARHLRFTLAIAGSYWTRTSVELAPARLAAAA